MDDAYMGHAPKDIDCTALIEQYDETAEQLLQVARSDGHFSREDIVTVSYTHLTLPTNREV